MEHWTLAGVRNQRVMSRRCRVRTVTLVVDPSIAMPNPSLDAFTLVRHGLRNRHLGWLWPAAYQPLDVTLSHAAVQPVKRSSSDRQIFRQHDVIQRQRQFFRGCELSVASGYVPVPGLERKLPHSSAILGKSAGRVATGVFSSSP